MKIKSMKVDKKDIERIAEIKSEGKNIKFSATEDNGCWHVVFDHELSLIAGKNLNLLK